MFGKSCCWHIDNPIRFFQMLWVLLPQLCFSYISDSIYLKNLIPPDFQISRVSLFNYLHSHHHLLLKLSVACFHSCLLTVYSSHSSKTNPLKGESRPCHFSAILQLHQLSFRRKFDILHPGNELSHHLSPCDIFDLMLYTFLIYSL